MTHRTIRLALLIAGAALAAGCAAPGPAEAPARPAGAIVADAAPLDRAEIREAQALLGRLGYGAGAADGVVGPQSRAAAQAFQAESGAPVSGRFDRGLLLMLRAAADAAGVALTAAPPPI